MFLGKLFKIFDYSFAAEYSYADYKNLLRETEDLKFHPKNIWRTRLLYEAVDIAVDEGLFELALQAALQNLEGMK